MKKLTLASLICLTLFSVKATAQWGMGKATKGSGKVITENRTTESYDAIKISGFFDIKLINDKEGKITIKGEDNIVPFIRVEVENNDLKVYLEKGKNFSPSNGKNIQITIPFETISALSLSGSGDILSNDIIKSKEFTAKLSGSGDLNLKIESQKFDLSLSGSGDISLDGVADDFKISISGSGDINASGLKTKNSSVSISGSGDVQVHCSESLYARVSGSGDVKYLGNPAKKDTKVSGSGEISKS